MFRMTITRFQMVESRQKTVDSRQQTIDNRQQSRQMTILSFGLSYQNKGCSECLKDDYITFSTVDRTADSSQQPADSRQQTKDYFEF